MKSKHKIQRGGTAAHIERPHRRGGPLFDRRDGSGGRGPPCVCESARAGSPPSAPPPKKKERNHEHGTQCVCMRALYTRIRIQRYVYCCGRVSMRSCRQSSSPKSAYVGDCLPRCHLRTVCTLIPERRRPWEPPLTYTPILTLAYDQSHPLSLFLLSLSFVSGYRTAYSIRPHPLPHQFSALA